MPPNSPAVPEVEADNIRSINPSTAFPSGDEQPLLTMKQVEELINRKMKERRGTIMVHFWERSAHLFTASLIAVRIPNSVIARPIREYNGGGDPIIHVKRHDGSLLGKSNDDDHFTLLFPSTFSATASSWFFGLPAGLIG